MEISKDIDPELVSNTFTFLEGVGMSDPVPDNCNTSDFYSDFIRSFLKLHEVNEVESFAPFSSNRLLLTVVVEEKELSLGELSMSYLSGAPTNAEVIADGSVVRSGRNPTVVAVEFKFNKTGMLIYTARATFYNMPVSKL